MRTSQPDGMRSEVIASGHTNGEAWRGTARRTPGFGAGRHIEMRCCLRSEGTKWTKSEDKFSIKQLVNAIISPEQTQLSDVLQIHYHSRYQHAAFAFFIISDACSLVSQL